MSIEVFKFLLDHQQEIVTRMKAGLRLDGSSYADMPDSAIGDLVNQVVEHFGDVMVTREAEVFDHIHRALSRIVAAGGMKLSEVFELPLRMSTVIRELLAEEYLTTVDEESFKRFSAALDETERAAHRIASRFVDVFSEELDRRVREHNEYLARAQQQFGVDLASFRIAAVRS